jgi:hypothetical protein
MEPIRCLIKSVLREVTQTSIRGFRAKQTSDPFSMELKFVCPPMEICPMFSAIPITFSRGRALQAVQEVFL